MGRKGRWRLTLRPGREEVSGARKRKGGAEAPPPCAMSSFTPVRDDHLGAAGPCGPWITRSAPWLPIKRRREPGLWPLFIVGLLRRGSNLAGWFHGSAVERATRYALSASPHGISAKPIGRGISRQQTIPPSAALGEGDLGLALPGELRVRLRYLWISPPASLGFLLGTLSDISFDAIGSRSPHTCYPTETGAKHETATNAYPRYSPRTIADARWLLHQRRPATSATSSRNFGRGASR